MQAKQARNTISTFWLLTECLVGSSHHEKNTLMSSVHNES